MVEDTPDDLIHDLFAARIWPNHPLGRHVLGSREVVQSFSRETILRHFSEEYRSQKIIIAVAGNVEHGRVVELFAERFNDSLRSSIAHDGAPPVLTPVLDMIVKPLEQVHLVVGFPGLPRGATERYALYVLNDVIGGGMSSRLFQEVRERRALVYSIFSGTQAYRDTGVLYISAATDAQNFPEVLRSILKETRTLKKDGMSADELRRAKDHLKGSLMLSLESTSSRMNRLAKQELSFGAFFSLDEMLGAIDRVQEEDVQSLIHRLLDEDQLALLTLGPLDRRSLPQDLLKH